jgi:hypothetical protein
MPKFHNGGSTARKLAEKLERTNAAAQLAIDQERLDRERKTARLKALREEREKTMPQPD